MVRDETVRLSVIGKLAWIKRQQTAFAAQPRQSPREMLNGESYDVSGRYYRLRVHEKDGPAKSPQAASPSSCGRGSVLNNGKKS